MILADVWKTTPFVALLLLAGLQNIDASLYEAARIDGASAWRQFRHVTLPLLKPAILVALIFRTLDAFRVFDLIYALTGGGPGTSTEPIALYTFNALLQNLQFGYGSALSVIVFADHLRPGAALHPVSRRRADGSQAVNARRWWPALVLALLVAASAFPFYWAIRRLAHARGPALPGSVAVAERAGARPLPRAVHRAELLAADPQLADRGRHHDRLLCRRSARSAPTRSPGFEFRGKAAAARRSFWLSAMFPQISVVSPLYLLLRALHLINTYPGLVLPYLTFAMPLTVWLLVGFFRQLPAELEEAAMVDGAGRLRAFWEVILPLAVPGIATTAILTFVYSWNEFLFALSFTLGPERQTVPVAIALFRGQYQVPWGQILAAAVVATAPVTLLVLAFQRRIVQGLTAGAVKGLTMASVRLEGVAKTYPNGHVAAQGLDLEIADGEFMVLVGPSGCGKSTALRMIAGLETPTAGRILIGDQDVTALPPQERDIAMVFQTYALYPHMTVRENLAFGLRMRGAAPDVIDQRVEEAARALGLEPVLARKPAQLSGGQRQRVALGRAIVREPKVFLFDEPLSNLDAKLRVETRAELARLHRRLGATVVYVTHDQEEAMTLGWRVAVMRDGFLQQVAPPMELYRQPANRFVAGFVGSPGMNFLPGDLPGDVGPAASAGAHARRPAARRARSSPPAAGTSTPGWTWSSLEGSELLVYLRLGAKGGRGRAPGGGAAGAGDRGGTGGRECVRPGPASLVRAGEWSKSRIGPGSGLAPRLLLGGIEDAISPALIAQGTLPSVPRPRGHRPNEARRTWSSTRRSPTSMATPTPATMLLMNATMLAVVVIKATSSPSRSAGVALASGQRPFSAAKWRAASGVSVR